MTARARAAGQGGAGQDMPGQEPPAPGVTGDVAPAATGEHKHDAVRRALQELAAGLRPGDALPGERQLERRFGVSRITVRRAVSDLVAAGVLTRVHGKGTYVSHGRVRSPLHLASFHEDMRAAGKTPSTRLLALDRAAPEREVREMLRLDEGEEAWRVRRLRLADGWPMSIDESWIPVSRAPGLGDQDLDHSLYGLLAAAGSPVLSAEQTLSARPCSVQDAALLGIAPEEPVLEFRRQSFTTAGPGEVPVEFSVSVYRADRYQLSMTVR